ncbi:MAG: hypothetical protein ACI31R_04410 [Bacilli bacterium]
MTFGRYIYNEIRNFYLASNNFYFNCDKLSEDLSRYQVDNWSGAESYSITFNMDSYDNNIKYASSDIDYDITYSCSSNVICDINKTSGVITKEKHTDSFDVIITPNTALNDGDEAWLEVETASVSPYEKTLSGRFVIKVGKMGVSYEIVDKVGSPYFDLNITNTLDYYVVKTAFGDYSVGNRLDISTYMDLSDTEKNNCASATITLDFDPNKVLLDMTNKNYLNSSSTTTTQIDGYSYIKGITFKVDALSSEVVRFYKKDASMNYSYPFVYEPSIINFSYD